jgi:hypothetical protein
LHNTYTMPGTDRAWCHFWVRDVSNRESPERS